MSMDKVVKRAIRDTLLAIAALYVFMVCTLCIFYPATMMELTYDMGMEKASIHFANNAYKRSGDVAYVAHATQVAIGIDDEKLIVHYGEKLIGDNEFSEFCDMKDEELGDTVQSSYKQYVYSQVCIARYEQGKKTAAVERAVELTGNEFPRFNAVAAVLLSAIKSDDIETVSLIGEKMQEIEYDGLSDEDKEYYDAVFALINDENGYAS